MSTSERIQGQHATPSPWGTFIAYTTSSSANKLRISAAHAPGRYVQFSLRVAGNSISALKWNDGRTRIAVISPSVIEVVDLDDAKHRVFLEGGSGIGGFVWAEFVGSERVFVVSEFGAAGVWDLGIGSKVLEVVGGVKGFGSSTSLASSGRGWSRRPGDGTDVLAVVSRPAAEDLLGLCFPGAAKATTMRKLPSVDARSVSWSPDGRWLAVLDTPTATPCVHFYTPDLHLYRSYPSDRGTVGNDGGLGAKALAWSRDSRLVALSQYDGHVVLLNTRTFAPLAMIEHTTRIDQHAVPTSCRAPIWQEVVSASGSRSYGLQHQPYSPPTSQSQSSSEGAQQGVIQACFSGDGSYLATREEQTLSTAWIWSTTTLSIQAVLVQHANIRRMQWHATVPGLLLVDCGEAVAYAFDARAREPPSVYPIEMPSGSSLSWLPIDPSNGSTILAANKTSFRLCYPDGAPQVPVAKQVEHTEQDVFDEGESEDSLLDMLSGRTPMGTKTEQSYTERIDLEVSIADAASSELQPEDTFILKTDSVSKDAASPIDPFDDSEIF